MWLTVSKIYLVFFLCWKEGKFNISKLTVLAFSFSPGCARSGEVVFRFHIMILQLLSGIFLTLIVSITIATGWIVPVQFSLSFQSLSLSLPFHLIRSSNHAAKLSTKRNYAATVKSLPPAAILPLHQKYPSQPPKSTNKKGAFLSY